ncbi:GTP 3',8-cyclase [Paenibacillus albidus]|uniref:GTP 3',8-cyclase n=1 Tax=Paenibacillus albidus TaxID=2041023 RepID=A0A917FBQ7_9BACL|nr:GTP 3',8-cyclase MoaA [Paenibacillus albidus]GGF68185.1 GTP 3',8-cyclase [Paenibacillus albidus]
MSDILVDSFGRLHNYVRISVTEHCNLGCQYCNPGRVVGATEANLLTYDEIVRTVSVLAEMGVTKVRLTGGEPLLRPNLEELVARLRAISGIKRVGLTTNGLLLANKVQKLRDAGLTDLNVSLDSLIPERFSRITGGGDVSKVLHALAAGFKAGFEVLKLNVVLMKGINDDEIESFLQLTLKYPLYIRFIEYMPMGRDLNGWEAGYMPLEGILERCAKAGFSLEADPHLGRASGEPTGKEADSGPARYFRIQGAAGEFGLINPVSQHFCNSCNRLRITANGHFKPCLCWNEELYIRPYIGQTELLKQLFLRALEAKPSQHMMSGQPGTMPPLKATNRLMSQIGG